MKAKFKRESSEPLYVQIKKDLHYKIEDGIYSVGNKIPSEPELCQKYDVSRITVRKAILELEEEGLLEKKQGKGTFVRLPSSKKKISQINSFHETCNWQNKTASSKVINARETNATAKDIEGLELTDNSKIIEITRLRLADDIPVILEINHFTTGFTYLLEYNLSGSLYVLLRSFGIEPNQASRELSLISATEEMASLLKVDVGSPLIFLYEVIYDQKGRPLHTSYQYIRGDLFTLKM
ncbi:MAG: GntR family transcriptional regulator [Ruminococcaceae bacterium]|nr:GntR family transcriptional regulator [Oscillospiraceae bacterium]